MRSRDPPAVETRKHLLIDPQKSRLLLDGFFVFILNPFYRPIIITFSSILQSKYFGKNDSIFAQANPQKAEKFIVVG